MKKNLSKIIEFIAISIIVFTVFAVILLPIKVKVQPTATILLIAAFLLALYIVFLIWHALIKDKVQPINPTFSVGDTVYIMDYDKLVEATIECIYTEVDEQGMSICYDLKCEDIKLKKVDIRELIQHDRDAVLKHLQAIYNTMPAEK